MPSKNFSIVAQYIPQAPADEITLSRADLTRALQAAYDAGARNERTSANRPWTGNFGLHRGGPRNGQATRFPFDLYWSAAHSEYYSIPARD